VDGGMREEWLTWRERLLFGIPIEEFEAACGLMLERYDSEFRNADDERRKDIACIIAELCIDMQSGLKKWHVQEPGAAGMISDETIERLTGRMKNYLVSRGYAQMARYIDNAAESIRKSNMMKLAVLTEQGLLNNYWGNDYASGLAEAMRTGAVIATTNPPIVNIAWKEDPEKWDKVKEELKSEYPNSDSARLASVMTMRIVLENCREMRPVFTVSGGRLGYICLQVNPMHASDSNSMVKEAEYLYGELERELHSTPNVLFKLPGTKASLEAARILTQKGIGVTITVSYSLDQLQAFAEVIESGNATLSFVVLMMGRLDDPVRDELVSVGLKPEDAAEASKWASTAVIRKAYQLLYNQKGFKKSRILAASLRGPWNIDGAVTDGEVPVFITSFPDKTKEYDSMERQPVSRINERMPDEVIEKLMKSQIFRKAYMAGSMRPEDFDTFHPVVVTLNSFVQSYHELIGYLEK
jgi:transaldolase